MSTFEDGDLQIYRLYAEGSRRAKWSPLGNWKVQRIQLLILPDREREYNSAVAGSSKMDTVIPVT
jgi:hypothetical protein